MQYMEYINLKPKAVVHRCSKGTINSLRVYKSHRHHIVPVVDSTLKLVTSSMAVSAVGSMKVVGLHNNTSTRQTCSRDTHHHTLGMCTHWINLIFEQILYCA